MASSTCKVPFSILSPYAKLNATFLFMIECNNLVLRASHTPVGGC